MLTRRCTQRQFLLRPDETTNQTFLYCLAVAAEKFRIEVILPSVMSNHHHTILFDRHGTIVEFMHHLHAMTGHAINAHRGRWENLWSSEQPSLVHLLGADEVLKMLVYAATNPVKDGLVERVHHWPGVNGLAALLSGRKLRIRRPRHYFRKNGRMPEFIELEFVIPPELGDPAEFRRTLRALVAAEERRFAEERRRTGQRVVGRRGVLAQPWTASSQSASPRRGLRPTLSAMSKWARAEALRCTRAFREAYHAARLAFLAGLDVVFPAGTYWLRRFANVRVAEI